MDDAEILARLGQSSYRWWKPLTEAAEAAIDYAQHPERRVYTGLSALDEAMHGTAPKQLTLVVGYAHNGKTLLVTHMALSNPDKVGLWVTPDESRLAVLSKLTAATSGVSWEKIERMLQDPQQEKEGKRLLYDTAAKFPNLNVVESALSPLSMSQAVEETEAALQRRVDYVIYDFAKLFVTEGDEQAKLNALKWWASETGYPTFVLHQTSRTAGRDGEEITIDSGKFGGEDVATFMIGVRRKRRWYESLIADGTRALVRETSHTKRAELQMALDEWNTERDRHLNSISVCLVKNKVPPMRLVEEFDLGIQWETGTLIPHDPSPVQTPVTMRQQVFGGLS